MLLGQTKRLNIVCADSVNTPVSVTLDRVSLDEALTSIVSVAGCSWTRQNGIIYVTNLTATAKLAAEVQGRQMRVFRLDFASALDMDLAIKGMLSPVGKSFVTAAKSTDNRKTQELVVVEDLPGYLQAIEQYVHQVDQPPRQVLIEAHVLSVDLQHDNKLGVNFQALIKQLGPLGGLQTTGFADPKAAQAFFFSVNRGDLSVLLEALTTQSNAKTLALPKVLVLNGQEAKIQIGDQLGFRVTTTTETSTLNNVSFLDVGVILKVTPRITADGQVLMQVHPEVSTGEINPLTQNPDSHTTMVESSVMLPDGRGMVIGGLIQESDSDTQQKIPILGDLWLIGRLFQRHEVSKSARRSSSPWSPASYRRPWPATTGTRSRPSAPRRRSSKARWIASTAAGTPDSPTPSKTRSVSATCPSCRSASGGSAGPKGPSRSMPSPITPASNSLVPRPRGSTATNLPAHVRRRERIPTATWTPARPTGPSSRRPIWADSRTTRNQPMNEELPLPTELQHLIEKRSGTARRRTNRRGGAERRQRDLQPLAAPGTTPESLTAAGKAETPSADRRRRTERRAAAASRRKRPRRRSDAAPRE